MWNYSRREGKPDWKWQWNGSRWRLIKQFNGLLIKIRNAEETKKLKKEFDEQTIKANG